MKCKHFKRNPASCAWMRIVIVLHTSLMLHKAKSIWNQIVCSIYNWTILNCTKLYDVFRPFKGFDVDTLRSARCKAGPGGSLLCSKDGEKVLTPGWMTCGQGWRWWMDPHGCCRTSRFGFAGERPAFGDVWRYVEPRMMALDGSYERIWCDQGMSEFSTSFQKCGGHSAAKV